jgi:cell division protein ZapA
MPEVFVEISGRKYRMACEEGQEAHLQSLAARFDGMVEQFKEHFGEIGDTRLTVMAGIAVLDNLKEAETRIEALNKRLDELGRAGEEVSREYETMETRFAKKMDEVARRIEAVAGEIDATAPET